MSVSARAVVAAAAPVMAGYVVLGIPCGILGHQAGLSLAHIGLMSLFLYSGAGQYLIPNLMLAGVPAASIVVSVSLVNTRQVLYAAYLSRHCGQASRPATLLFAATVTDESFGVNLERFSCLPGWDLRSATGVNLMAQTTWTLATLAGALLGSVLPVPARLASYAMTSIFLCLLFTQQATRRTVVAALVAIGGVVICQLAGLGGAAILVGALAGVAAALALPEEGS